MERLFIAHTMAMAKRRCILILFITAVLLGILIWYVAQRRYVPSNNSKFVCAEVISNE